MNKKGPWLGTEGRPPVTGRFGTEDGFSIVQIRLDAGYAASWFLGSHAIVMPWDSGVFWIKELQLKSRRNATKTGTGNRGTGEQGAMGE